MWAWHRTSEHYAQEVRANGYERIRGPVALRHLRDCLRTMLQDSDPFISRVADKYAPLFGLSQDREEVNWRATLENVMIFKIRKAYKKRMKLVMQVSEQWLDLEAAVEFFLTRALSAKRITDITESVHLAWTAA